MATYTSRSRENGFEAGFGECWIMAGRHQWEQKTKQDERKVTDTGRRSSDDAIVLWGRTRETAPASCWPGFEALEKVVSTCTEAKEPHPLWGRQTEGSESLPEQVHHVR